MKITIELEDTTPEDLLIQHMAEQSESGHVIDWIHGLIDDALAAHPDYRECSDTVECCEKAYPTMTVRPVDDDSWKKYRVTTSPTEHCPRCGKPTVPVEKLEVCKAKRESDAAFVAGRCAIPGGHLWKKEQAKRMQATA
jgi:hypothetical protein